MFLASKSTFHLTTVREGIKSYGNICMGPGEGRVGEG